MNAVIVGCGKVGQELARTLVNDGHNVSLIDNNQKPIDQISEELDVMALLGNGADINILYEAGLRNADIFIAVSTSDELNLLTCLMAKQETKCETIARVRNPLYSKETNFIKDRLGLSKIINPEHLAANEIYNLLQFPALSRIDLFEGSDVTISMMHVYPEYKFVGKSLMQIRRELPGSNTLVCAAMRKGEIIIPDGRFEIQAGDDITMVATRDELRRFLKTQGVRNTPAENIMIAGGGTISYYLVEKLLRRGKKVRLIEKNEKRCLELSEIFPDADIVLGDGTDRRFLMRHGLSTADAFIPLTGIDEENIVIATYAKNTTHAKIITKVTRTDMNDLIQTLNIDSVVFPKLMCADIIAQYVRAKSAGAGGNVATLFRYLDNSIEIVELVASSDPTIVNRPIMELNIKKNLIIAGIIHGRDFTVPSGKNVIREGDSVIIVTTNRGISSLRDILA